MASGEVGSLVTWSPVPSVVVMIQWRTISEIEETAAGRAHRDPVHVSGRSYRAPGRS